MQLPCFKYPNTNTLVLLLLQTYLGGLISQACVIKQGSWLDYCIDVSIRILIHPPFWSCIQLSFIRPHLEYSSGVWSPHLKGEVEAIEKVQKYALKVCMKSWDASYADLLSMTSLPSMQCRHLQASLCHLLQDCAWTYWFPRCPHNSAEISL